MNIQKIKEHVKYNCNIADSQSWGYYSICGLLLRLRDLYRHEHELKHWDTLPNDEILVWIEAREKLWEDLQGNDFKDIEINGVCYEPFDSEQINSVVNNHGFAYGGGYGLYHKPTFFLAQLREKERVHDFQVLYTGEELCRDISTAPAMLQGKTIWIRLEQLNVLLWAKLLELQGRKFGGALKEAFSHYGIEGNEKPSKRLFDKINRISLEVSEILTWHEIGEAVEDEHLDEWLGLMNQGVDKYLELTVRGIKDLLADTSDSGTLKMMIDRRSKRLLSFFVILLNGIRKELFPEMLNAFQKFVESGDWSIIEQARKAGYGRAKKLRNDILEMWREDKGIEEIKSFLRQQSGIFHGKKG